MAGMRRRSEVEEQMRPWAEGAAVKVYYDPGSPASSALLVGAASAGWLPLLFAGILGIMGALMLHG